ncbi:proton-coupled zinc antiporter SLC30A1-like isoform X2 [Branchiostoma floridae x Branchiostoma belcheri]
MGRYSGKTCRLMTLIVLTGLFFVVEITVGYVTNSMALVADSFHCLSDMVSLIVGLSAMRFSKKRVVHLNTFGWVRAEVLGGLVNSIFLLALCFSILVESFKRLIMPEIVETPLIMVIIGGVSLAFYIFGMGLLRGLMVSRHGHLYTKHTTTEQEPDQSSDTSKDHIPSRELVSDTDSGYDVDPDIRSDSDHQLSESHSSIDSDMDTSVCKPQNTAVTDATEMNLRGVFLHVLGDALSSLIIVINALIIMYVQGDWTKYCDPVLSILMVIIIIATTVPLLRQSASILLQSVPPTVRMKTLRSKLQKIAGIVSIHEFHVWPLTGEKIVATLHVVFLSPLNYMEICHEIKDLFHDEGIHSATIQPEFSQGVGSSCHCLLDCNTTCGPNQCCTTDTQPSTQDQASLRTVLFPCLGSRHPEDDVLIQEGVSGRRTSLNKTKRFIVTRNLYLLTKPASPRTLLTLPLMPCARMSYPVPLTTLTKPLLLL